MAVALHVKHVKGDESRSTRLEDKTLSMVSTEAPHSPTFNPISNCALDVVRFWPSE